VQGQTVPNFTTRDRIRTSNSNGTASPWNVEMRRVGRWKFTAARNTGNCAEVDQVRPCSAVNQTICKYHFREPYPLQNTNQCRQTSASVTQSDCCRLKIRCAAALRTDRRRRVCIARRPKNMLLHFTMA
jgi:hypothetical protein